MKDEKIMLSLGSHIQLIYIYIYRLIYGPVNRSSWVFHNNGKNNSDKNNLNLKHNLKSYSVHLQDITSHLNTITSVLNKLCGDGFVKFIYKYKSKRCQMKNIFSARNRVLSTASKWFFETYAIVYLDCHLRIVIYLINCSRFYLQYLEEACQEINERLIE